jgi:hypothetical protein
LQQSKGERAQAGTDLEDDVVRGYTRRGNDPSYGIGVGNEILATLLAGPQA